MTTYGFTCEPTLERSPMPAPTAHIAAKLGATCENISVRFMVEIRLRMLGRLVPMLYHNRWIELGFAEVAACRRGQNQQL